MRVRVTVDDDLVATARKYVGVGNISELLNIALKALVERESARWLAAAGGSQPDLEDIPRRRPWDDEEE